ncbi:MAG: oligosaccharide flippase family protein [Hyphomonadaceae bacterium]|nr:oligosaccharide flippase family protein [Hyphomonadaceae bacterium]
MKSSAAFSRSAVTSVLSILVGLITGIIAARILGPEARGYLGVIVFWPQFLATFGRPPFADAIVVSAGDQDEGVDRVAIFKTALNWAWGSAAIVAPIFLILLYLILREFPDPVPQLGLGFGLILLFCSFQAQVFEGILRSNHRFDMVNIFRLSVPILYLTFLLFAVYMGLGLTGFVVSHICAMLLSYLFRVFLIDTKNSSHDEAGTGSHDSKKRTGSFGALLRVFYGGTLLTFLGQHIDRAMVMLTFEAHDIGLYLAAITLAAPVQGIVAATLSTVGLPVLVSLPKQVRTEAYKKLLKLSFATSLFAALAIAAIAPFAATFLFGREFADSGLMASWIACATVFVPVRRAANQIFKAEKMGHTVTASEALYACVFVSVYVVALLLGGAWPFIAAFAIGNLVSIIFASWRLYRVSADITPLKWLIPSPSIFVDLSKILIAGLSSRGRS